ncbi:MAG: ArsR/SmtB family transcription factor [Rhizobiaceae bacterium]
MTNETNLPAQHSSKMQLAKMLKAMGHPVRLRIVEEIAKRQSCCCGEMCDCFPLSQSTVSQHLSVLKKAGIVEVEQKGTSSRYSLDPDALNALRNELSDLVDIAGCCCND